MEVLGDASVWCFCFGSTKLEQIKSSLLAVKGAVDEHYPSPMVAWQRVASSSPTHGCQDLLISFSLTLSSSSEAVLVTESPAS